VEISDLYRHKKKVISQFAADVSITNCGGFILWLGDDDGEYVYCQEEVGMDGFSGFSKLMRKTIYTTGKGQYVNHKGRRFYFSDFYRRSV